MKLSTKVGLVFVAVGFLIGFFDRQLFGQGSNAVRATVILGLGVVCLVTMFVLSRRDRRHR